MLRQKGFTLVELLAVMAIIADTALQLEEVMPEIPAHFWLNLETDYQLTRALIRRGRRSA